MSTNLQQALTELQQMFDQPGGSKQDITKRLKVLKLELAQSGLYFAPSSANPQDLQATRSILEIATFHSLRQSDLKSYAQYNASLQPFYTDLSTILPPSPNRPVIIGLHLLSLLSEGRLTEFHTALEALDSAELGDVFIKWPVDLERWLMEGAYNKVYRARERVPREEYGVLLDNLMGTVRGQIASTIEASYPSLPIHNASALLFFKSGETSQLTEFANSRGWTLQPSTQTFTFPLSSTSDIAKATSQDPSIAALEALKGQGVVRGSAMSGMIQPALMLAQQLEAIV